VAEWPIERDMQGNGVEFIILDMCQFLLHGVFNQDGLFFDLMGPLAVYPQLIQNKKDLCVYDNCESFRL
jgi:hypothetical protein